jgi:hypothetical protein
MTCPLCCATAGGNFCSACGAGLTDRACAACRAELAPQARFCHRCGTPVSEGSPRRLGSDRNAWIIAALLCVALVGGIAYKVSSSSPQPAVPDMANTGASGGDRAPDISSMSPRERFDRLFNRIMQAAERGQPEEIERFTPMALGAYEQLETRDVDARYHAAVIYLQGGGVSQARALADTMLQESPGHLFGYIIRGTAARMAGDAKAEAGAQRDFLQHYPAEMAANRVEYLEHKPVVEEFRQEAERAE